MAVTSTTAGDDQLHLADVRRRVKAIFIGSVGNLVEWYDFYAYAAFALYFAGSFFPGDDPVVQQLNAAVLFAFGFIVRPIGGWLFGHLADQYGRRSALMLSVLLMCFGSLIIAVLPTYASIGIAAPVLLGVTRMIQGLSLGGEYGTSATYLTEVADEKHRGFYSSFQYVTLIGGQLCAILVLLLLQQVFLTPEQLRAWGWRIPFVIGALLAIVALVMRRNLHETDDFLAAQKTVLRRESSIKALMKYPREVLVVVGLTMGGTTAFYTYTTYMQKFLKLSVGLNDIQTTMVTAGSLVFALFLQPLYGALSDKIGRKPLLIWFGVMGTVCTIPLLYSLQATKSALVAFLLIAGAWLIVAGYTSINAVVKAELFPTKVRATGVGLPYAITVSIFGGTAESIALWFKSIGHETWFYYYLTGLIATSLVVYASMRDTKHQSAMGRHE
ncbi:MAG: alpha-ketoglutarate permease [Acidobacteria bacterium RIFCSPLOWO2_12_FULL_66_10]|nr:MAG: alpha-ketoglutarate permease [Acidobacteria bacterium RIFCSPLOWO2_12_FULL_66_10]